MSEEEKTFEDFFNEAMDEEDGIKKDKEEAEVKEEEEPKKEEEVTDPPKEEVDEGAKPASDDDATLADALAEIEKLNHKMSSWQGRITKANDRAKVAEEELAKLKEQKESAPEKETPSEDSKVLTEFASEFPDLVEPLKQMAKKYAEEIADERLGKVTPTIEKLQEQQKQTEEEKFYKPIDDAHPDWRTIYENGDLKKWIDTQPPLQQRVFNTVVDNGSNEEIIDMFTTYKKAMGILKQNNKTSEGKVDPNVHNIVAVPSKSAGPPAGQPDKSDFEAGWKDANA